MPSYLSLINWTEQGIQSVKDAPARVDNFKQAVKDAGGRVIFFYMLMGEWDVATLIEVADDATAARVLLNNGMLGNVRTQTMKAFTEEEFRTIVGSL